MWQDTNTLTNEEGIDIVPGKSEPMKINILRQDLIFVLFFRCSFPVHNTNMQNPRPALLDPCQYLLVVAVLPKANPVCSFRAYKYINCLPLHLFRRPDAVIFEFNFIFLTVGSPCPRLLHMAPTAASRFYWYSLSGPFARIKKVFVPS